MRGNARGRTSMLCVRSRRRSSPRRASHPGSLTDRGSYGRSMRPPAFGRHSWRHRRGPASPRRSARCARGEARNAWLTLDVRDDEPVRLWTYVAAALERMCPGADASRRRRAAAHGRQGTGPRGPRRRRGRRADRRRPHPRQRPHGARGTATELDLADRVHPPSTEEPHDEQFSRGVLAARLGGRELRATGPARVAAGDGDVRVVPRGFVGGEPHTVGVAYTASPEGEQALRSGVVAVDAAIAEPAAHSKARSTSCTAIRPRRCSDSPVHWVCW
jgi:hypothetical protein